MRVNDSLRRILALISEHPQHDRQPPAAVVKDQPEKLPEPYHQAKAATACARDVWQPMKLTLNFMLHPEGQQLDNFVEFCEWFEIAMFQMDLQMNTPFEGWQRRVALQMLAEKVFCHDNWNEELSQLQLSKTPQEIVTRIIRGRVLTPQDLAGWYYQYHRDNHSNRGSMLGEAAANAKVLRIWYQFEFTYDLEVVFHQANAYEWTVYQALVVQAIKKWYEVRRKLNKHDLIDVCHKAERLADEWIGH